MSDLTKALVELQANLPTIVKGETAEVPTKNGGKYTYTYADLADISDALLPRLSNHGLAFAACPTLRDDGQFVLRYQLRHVGGENITEDYPLPLQGGPQAQGSAITYARRYCLCAVTGVAPEDDDGRAAQRAAEAPPAPEPIDLAPLEAAIINAQDAGVVKTDAEWSKLREYAGRSAANVDKAIERLQAAVAETAA